MLAVFLTVSAVIGTSYIIKTVRTERDNERRRTEAAPYELERAKIERELASFDAMINRLSKGGATMTPIIIGADEAIYTNIYTIFTEVNADLLADAVSAGGGSGEITAPSISATVCLTADELPGGEGMMSIEQLGELIEAGWTVAVYASSEDARNLGAFLSDMRLRFDELGIEWTDTVCFECGIYGMAYDPNEIENAYDATLKAHGITTAIDIVNEGLEILSQDTDSDIWRVKADGWSLSDSKGSAVDNYHRLLNHRGAMAFVIEVWHGANREGPTHFLPDDSDESMKRMFVKFSESVAAGELVVGHASGGKQHYEDYLENYTLAKEFYRPQREALAARLGEVKQKLYEIYHGE